MGIFCYSIAATIVTLILVFPCNASLYTCPGMCKCDSHEAECIDKDLTYIPTFNQYITSVTFTGNNLGNVTEETLLNLTSLTLEVLVLRHDNITELCDNALQSLMYLRQLDLSGNSLLTIDHVAACLSLVNSLNLTSVTINSFGWNEEPIAIYGALSSKNVTRLSMSRNNIKTLNFSAMGENLPSLTYINAAYNRIQTLIPGNLSKLEEFIGHHNYIEVNEDLFISDQCNFPNLKILNLTSNFINYFENRFVCLNSLEILVLDKNPVKTILKDSFVNLTSLVTLSLNHLGDRLYFVEGHAFRNSKLKTLRFSQNHFPFIKSSQYTYFYPDYIFDGIPSLEDLDLSENEFNLTDGSLNRMLSKLKNLRRLTIKSCRFRTIPPNIFYNMPSLEVLNLTRNHICSWNGSNVFGYSSSLKTLILDYNYINVFNETSFPETMMTNITEINLAHNPFYCSCKNLRFRRWIEKWINKKPTLFTEYRNNYRCINPPELEGKELKDYYPSDEDCLPVKTETFLSVISAMCMIGIITLMVAIVLYKGRWHIRYWIYLYRSKNNGYTSINGDGSYLYSGFVVYCDEDRKWVLSKFLKVIEEENNLKLCIHHRDFEVGKLIVDNIAESIAQSKKVVLIMSSDMIKSDWCLFETRLAEMKFLNRENGSLIVVMLENVLTKDIPQSLRLLIEVATYVTWSEESDLEDRFWTKVIKTLQE